MDQVFQNAVFEAGELDLLSLTVTSCVRGSSATAPQRRTGCAQPPERRSSACTRASSSSK